MMAARDNAAPSRSRWRSIPGNPYVWAFLLGVVGLTLLRPLLRHEPAPPPVLSHLPPFDLVAGDGETFGTRQLAGHVWVANFVFTRCTSICPALTASMRRLQDRLDGAGVDGVRLVSISVDPAYDTPDRLRDYADRHGADPARWTFLTGDPDEVRKLVVEGFRTPMGPQERDGDVLVEIAHTGKLVLVDGGGGIRGYYDSDETGIDEVFHRSRHVLREGGVARASGAD
jgi:protein SCO1/2